MSKLLVLYIFSDDTIVVSQFLENLL